MAVPAENPFEHGDQFDVIAYADGNVDTVTVTVRLSNTFGQKHPYVFTLERDRTSPVDLEALDADFTRFKDKDGDTYRLHP